MTLRTPRGILLCAATGVLAACGVVLPAPDAALPVSELDAEPRAVEGGVEMGQPAVGPTVEVVRGEVDGERFGVTVYRTADGTCMQLARGDEASGLCGSMPGDGLTGLGAFGSIAHGAGVDEPREVAGIVSPAAAAVWVELGDGTRARAHLVALEDAEIDAQAFITFIADGPALAAIVALDGAGVEIGRISLEGEPGVGPGGVPTPDSP